MKIHVAIQSYKRAGAVDTLKVFPGAFLWVHQFEAREYRKHYGRERIEVLPDALRGNLPRVKNHILDNAFRKFRADFILFLDDDISQLAMHENRKKVVLSPGEAFNFALKYSMLCQEWGYYAWGVNVNYDKQCYREYTPFSTLSYVSSSFFCARRGIKTRYDHRFPLKEDYDMTLQMCQEYRGILRVNKAFYVKKSAENVGGCAMYRDLKAEQEQFRALQKKWGPNLVRADSLGNSQSHALGKIKKFDINPIVRVPIRGV